MPDAARRKQYLDPAERISEVLFGLIMVLTFTGSLSVVEAERSDVRDMLIGALGCNLAWGIIDAFMYLMGCLIERSRDLLTLRAVRDAADVREAHRAVAEALPPLLASALETAEIEAVRERLKRRPDPGRHARFSKADWLGALAVFVLVFASVFPVVLPFVFMTDVKPALRSSNAIAIAMLFGIGWAFGRQVGRPPWRVGVWMVLIGVVIVGMTIALGG